MALTTKKSELSAVASREVLKLTSKLVRRTVAEHVPAPRDALSALSGFSDHTASNGVIPLAQRIRPVPIQLSIDIAVPVAVAFEEWMKLEFLPEGAHRIVDIKRRRDRLRGRIDGARAQHSLWRAEIREERPYESFAWRSVTGSDCLGLITFHRLAERLTRLELELDVVPVRAPEAFELLVHVADRRAEIDLRRFKARLERISPDDYPAYLKRAGESQQGDHDEED